MVVEREMNDDKMSAHSGSGFIAELLLLMCVLAPVMKMIAAQRCIFSFLNGGSL